MSPIIMAICQFLLLLLCKGPLCILFLGNYDPWGMIKSIQWTMRNFDANILNLRPPIYCVNDDMKGKEITIPLRDGVVTAATLYSPLPTSKDTTIFIPRPVVLVQTPYSQDIVYIWGVRFAERGYHFVVQDTR